MALAGLEEQRAHALAAPGVGDGERRQVGRAGDAARMQQREARTARRRAARRASRSRARPHAARHWSSPRPSVSHGSDDGHQPGRPLAVGGQRVADDQIRGSVNTCGHRAAPAVRRARLPVGTACRAQDGATSRDSTTAALARSQGGRAGRHGAGAAAPAWSIVLAAGRPGLQRSRCEHDDQQRSLRRRDDAGAVREPSGARATAGSHAIRDFGSFVHPPAADHRPGVRDGDAQRRSGAAAPAQSGRRHSVLRAGRRAPGAGRSVTIDGVGPRLSGRQPRRHSGGRLLRPGVRERLLRVPARRRPRGLDARRSVGGPAAGGVAGQPLQRSPRRIHLDASRGLHRAAGRRPGDSAGDRAARHGVGQALQVPEPDAHEVLGPADLPRRDGAAAARLRPRDDQLPRALRAGSLLARRAARVPRGQRPLPEWIERRLPADDRRHVPAPESVLRRFLRGELGERRSLRRRAACRS